MNLPLLFELELPLLGPWVLFLGLGLVGFAGGYFRWFLAIPPLMLLALVVAVCLVDLHEPDIYPVLQKQDPSHLPLMYLGITIAVLLPIVGVILNLRPCRKLA
jgi:hypothetical protein